MGVENNVRAASYSKMFRYGRSPIVDALHLAK